MSSYKLFLFIIILILSPKLIHAACSDIQHTVSNAASPGIPGASMIVINHSGYDLDYASNFLETGEWVTPACNPKNFQTVPNGQTLNIAAISTKQFIGYSGTKGSFTYNIMDGPSPGSITVSWDTPALSGNKYIISDYDTTKYVVGTKITGPGNELCTVTIGKIA